MPKYGLFPLHKNLTYIRKYTVGISYVFWDVVRCNSKFIWWDTKRSFANDDEECFFIIPGGVSCKSLAFLLLLHVWVCKNYVFVVFSFSLQSLFCMHVRDQRFTCMSFYYLIIFVTSSSTSLISTMNIYEDYTSWNSNNSKATAVTIHQANQSQ